MSLRSWILSSFLLLLLAASGLATEADHSRVLVFSKATIDLLNDLEQAGFDVAGINRLKGYVEVIASPEDLLRLRRMGCDFKVIETWAGTRAVPAGYRDYDAIRTILFDTEAAFPEIARVIDLGSVYGTDPTYEGREFYVLKISDNVFLDEDEPNVYITCNHHAREITTAEYGLFAIEKLTTLYTQNPRVTEWVNGNQIYIAPTFNPDGLEYCFDVYGYWRKNRKPSGGGNYGIDINRNFDFNWDGPYGGSTDPASETYRGPWVASEEETQAEVAFALERHFAKVLDLHSFGGEVLYTYYSSSSFPTVLENYFVQKAQEFSNAFNYGWIRKASAEGEHYQWELNRTGAFAFLTETGNDFQPSYSVAQSEFADHIWPGISWLMDFKIPLTGRVREALTGLPLEADISVAGINYTEDEVRMSEPRFGRYYYFLPAGTYDITFKAPGHKGKTLQVSITANSTTQLDVDLLKLPKRMELAPPDHK